MASMCDPLPFACVAISKRVQPVILIQPPQDLEKVIELHGGTVCPISQVRLQIAPPHVCSDFVQVINGEVTGILDQAKYAQ